MQRSLKDFNVSINSFLTEGSIFVVNQIVGDTCLPLAIFKEKQEAEKFIKKREGFMEYIIATAIFANEE